MIANLIAQFSGEVNSRLAALTESAAAGDFDAAVDLMATCIDAGGVIHAYGTGHSEAFAMELAGRAGGLIPTNKVALRDVVLWGERTAAELVGFPPLERDPGVAAEVYGTVPFQEHDIIVIASNSGVNGSIVGMALLAQEAGVPVIAVTSLEHTARVAPLHPSGKRLSEIADVVIDNRAPYGDTVLTAPVPVGAVSSITSAYIAQLLTVATVDRLAGRMPEVPVFLSANIPGGDEHNRRFEAHYGARIRRIA